MTKAAPLGLRLFLEGVEVPVIAAQVDIQPNSPATASIQIVPADTALALLPRTLVHLFYLDHAAFEEYSGDGPMTEDDQAFVTSQPELNRFVAPDRYYKLLFCGEMIGINYAKTPVSRQMILQCMDLSLYWDTCYQWFADYSTGGDALTDKSHNFVGAGHGLFDNVAGGTKWVIGNILRGQPLTPEYQKASGLLGGLIHLLETIGGIKWRNSDFPGYNGVTDFFTIGELRFNMLGMLGAVEEDKTSVKIYNSKAFFDWLRNGMTSMGNLISFRDILNHVSRYIFHDVYPNPCAYYTSGQTGNTTISTSVPTTTFQETAAGTRILSALKKIYGSLASAWHALRRADQGEEEAAIGPLGASRDVVSSVSSGDTMLRSIKRDLELLANVSASLRSDDKASVNASINDALSKVSDASALFLEGNKPIYSSESDVDILSGGDLQSRAHDARDLIVEAQNAISDLIGVPRKGTKKVPKKVQVTLGAHLYTQLVFPETFFLAPPRCNVIFPDQYFSLNYSRNFLREVTRLSLQGGMGMFGGGGGRGGAIIGNYYFAPDIVSAEGRNLRVTMQYGGRLVLPHEVHSGIVPKFEWIQDAQRWAVKATRVSGEKVTEGNKVNYLQRLANFHFFLNRWSSRSMNVAGIFNPRLVIGLPGLVLDRAAPPPHVQLEITKELGRNLLPTQYLGKIIGLSHSINQATAQTTVGMSHCRTHNAYDDEFLGTLVDEVTSLKQQRFTETFRPDHLELTSGKYLEGDIRLINLYLTRELKVGVLIPEFGAKVVKVSTEGQSELSLDYALDWGISTHGKLSTEEVPGENVLEFVTVEGTGDLEGQSVIPVPASMSVTLERPVTVSEFEAATPEDALMPGWYDKAWHKENIGKAVYKPLLGTLAITDAEELTADALNQMLQNWANQGASAPLIGTGTAGVESAGKFTAIEVATGSLQAAIDSLGIVYGMLKTAEKGQVHEFIERYTYRPIANMHQVMGSPNLEFNDDGTVKDPATMFEGFHSRAFGDYNVGGNILRETPGKDALKGLFPGLAARDIPHYKRPVVVSTGDRSALKSYLDPRGRSRGRVLAYSAELKVSRGLLGG